MMSVLAFDLGASSGRAIVGHYQDQIITIEEIHRFSNGPVQILGRLHWDILYLFKEIKQGLVKSRQLNCELQGMAIDSWALDFGLIDDSGQLLGNPYHYRDDQTLGMMDKVFQRIGKEDIFSRTGIQFMPVNTLYHLHAMATNHSSLLKSARRLLMIPDLIRYFLTGNMLSEYTNATTTQLYNAHSRAWDQTILDRIDVPVHLFGPVVEPGTFAGYLSDSLCRELSIPSLPVIAVGEHDTASAVVAIPTEQADFAYVSCGTWSLMGTELNEPLINDTVLEHNFTNEGGVDGTIRLLKNIMGLWILQECRRIWDSEGVTMSYSELVEAAESAPPFLAFINPDHESFLHPEHMPRAIQHYCVNTGQTVPLTVGEITRCIIESLALTYRRTLTILESLVSKKYDGLHLVGGGSQNKLLCQFTSNAIARPVWAGPSEASAIGNIAVQYMTLEAIGSLQEARSIIKASFPIQSYEPDRVKEWDDAYANFIQIIDH